MTNEHNQSRLQRIEGHLRNLDQRVSVISVVEDESVKKRIMETFANNPRMVITLRGVRSGLAQMQIAEALKVRNLPGSEQPRVSESIGVLEERGFLRKLAKGSYVPVEGWDHFGLEKVLKKVLKDHRVDDLR
jgi:hypothetical protein